MNISYGIDSNSFMSTSLSQTRWELSDQSCNIVHASVELARKAADKMTAQTPDKPRFVAGSIGPIYLSENQSSSVNLEEI